MACYEESCPFTKVIEINYYGPEFYKLNFRRLVSSNPYYSSLLILPLFAFFLFHFFLVSSKPVLELSWIAPLGTALNLKIKWFKWKFVNGRRKTYKLPPNRKKIPLRGPKGKHEE